MPRDPREPGASAGRPRSVRVTVSSMAATRVTTPVSDQAHAPTTSATSSFDHGTASTCSAWTMSVAAGTPSAETGANVGLGVGEAGPCDPVTAAAVGCGASADRLSPHGLASATTTNATTRTGTASQRRSLRGGPTGSG